MSTRKTARRITFPSTVRGDVHEDRGARADADRAAGGAARRAGPRSTRLGWNWGGWEHAPGPFAGQQGAGAPRASDRGGDGSASAARRSVGLGFHPDLPDARDWVLRPKQLKPQVVKVLEAVKRLNAERAAGGGSGRGVKAAKGVKATKGVKAAEVVKAAQGTRSTARAGRAASRARSAKAFQSFLLDGGQPPAFHDLRETGYFSPVEDQREIGSCTAQAVVGLVEYLMRAGGVGTQDMSRMFLYKTTRRLLGWTGDTGAYVRSTIKALTLFGVPPEHEWSYDEQLLDAEPDAYHYSFAGNFKALVYARVDGYEEGDTLDTIKRALLDGFPVVFGFPVYESVDDIRPPDYVIPCPSASDRLLGGHAVLAVGYDDSVDYQTTDLVDAAKKKAGALIIRNSWGERWGEQGYARLPYWYVTKALATDFWTIFNSDWVELGEFE